jgi:nucleoside 2-deoxyribosyltransferase
VAIEDGHQVDDGTAWERGSHVAKGRKGMGIRTDLRTAGEFRSYRVNARIESSCILVKDLEGLLAEQERLLS